MGVISIGGINFAPIFDESTPEGARRLRRIKASQKGWETRRTQAATRRQWEERTGVPHRVFSEWVLKQPPHIARLDDESLVARFKATN